MLYLQISSYKSRLNSLQYYKYCVRGVVCRKSSKYHHSCSDRGIMDAPQKIVQFFKSIWDFVKNTWRIIVHAKLFHNPHSIIMLVVLVAFFVMLCICPCWAQYLDENSWRKYPPAIKAPSPDEYNICQTIEIGEPELEVETSKSTIFSFNKY